MPAYASGTGKRSSVRAAVGVRVQLCAALRHRRSNEYQSRWPPGYSAAASTTSSFVRRRRDREAMLQPVVDPGLARAAGLVDVQRARAPPSPPRPRASSSRSAAAAIPATPVVSAVQQPQAVDRAAQESRSLRSSRSGNRRRCRSRVAPRRPYSPRSFARSCPQPGVVEAAQQIRPDSAASPSPAWARAPPPLRPAIRAADPSATAPPGRRRRAASLRKLTSGTCVDAQPHVDRRSRVLAPELADLPLARKHPERIGDARCEAPLRHADRGCAARYDPRRCQPSLGSCGPAATLAGGKIAGI